VERPAAGVEVIYTRSGETADNAIEKLARRMASHQTVYVVTDDFWEQRIIRIILGYGALRMTSRELKAQMDRLKKAALALGNRGQFRNPLKERLW